MDRYIVETWPDIQYFMNVRGFSDHSYLIDDEKGIDDFGSSAYFVEETWHRRALKQIKMPKKREITLKEALNTGNQILELICDKCKVTKKEIIDKCRKKEYVLIREIFCHHAIMAGLSKSNISRVLNRNHSSVINALLNYKNDFQTDKSFKLRAEVMEIYLKEKGLL